MMHGKNKGDWTEYDGDPREREDRKRRLLCKKRGNKGKIRHEGGGEEMGERIREGHAVSYTHLTLPTICSV